MLSPTLFNSIGRTTHVTRDKCFLGREQHITMDMSCAGRGTHITRNTGITRDMCFLGGKNISQGMCVSEVGEHI